MSNDFTNLGRSYQIAGAVDRVMRVATDGSQVSQDRYAELAERGLVFHFSRAAVTVPVNASNLVSVFAVVNPASSGKMLELIEAEAHAVVATTVVSALGLYAGPVSGATLTTPVSGGILSSRLGEGVPSVCTAYSALTHSGTPVLADILGGWGAVTDGGSTPIYKGFKGRIQVPPGNVVHLAMTTAASTGSGISALLRWAELPYQNM